MKVILTKNITFIITFYNTKLQFEKISRAMKKMNFGDFYAHVPKKLKIFPNIKTFSQIETFYDKKY